MIVNPEIQDVLQERETKYGPFDNHALITQQLKWVMGSQKGYGRLNVSQRESLDMIAHKIGRILNGDPNYADSWVDIAGYAQLIVNELHAKT